MERSDEELWDDLERLAARGWLDRGPADTYLVTPDGVGQLEEQVAARLREIGETQQGGEGDGGGDHQGGDGQVGGQG